MKALPILTLAALLCAGCTPEDVGRTDTEFGPKPLFDPVVLPTSVTGGAILPLPIDLLFGREPGQDDDPANPASLDNNADGTLAPAGSLAAIPGWGLADGWSTTAAMFFDVQGKVDVAAAADGIRVFDSRRGIELQPDLDFTVTRSPVSVLTARLVVHWLRPLAESTRYLVAVTRDLRSPDGAPALDNELFAELRSATPVAELAEQPGTLISTLNRPGRDHLIPALAAIQSGFIAPVLGGVEQLAAVAANSRGGLQRDEVVLAWSFTTQSIRPTLDSLNAKAAARVIQAQDSGLNLGQVLGSPTAPLALPPGADADVYLGAFSLPYFHQPGAQHVLNSVWRNDGVIVEGAVHPGTGAPCAALLPPSSTTLCYPSPQSRSDELVPLLLTRPPAQMPASGWPAVIFLHGIGGNRGQMLAVAGSLAQAGFVTIAIDQPLHGVAADSALRVPGTTERTFDADLDGNGVIDDSGAYFINPASPMTSRDNLRQSVSDQLHLQRSLSGLRLGPDGAEFVNPERVHFLGHSLGGIVGGTLLGANADLAASVLAMPGGGVVKLLDASATFGPILSAGLAEQGIVKGTDRYEIFLRIVQLALDPADPINWIAAAAEPRALLLVEVLDDQVVPNEAFDNVFIPGFLSGTEPLARVAGLPATDHSLPALNSPPTAGSLLLRYSDGDHGSLLRPRTANPLEDDVFVDMQRQVATFLATDGACLPLGGSCSAR